MSAIHTSHAVQRRRPSLPQLRHFLFEYLLALPAGAVAALIWSTLDPERYFRFSTTAAFAVNEVAMVFFFALITKEVVEAAQPGGALHPWRRTALAIVAAFAASALTLAMFSQLIRVFEEPMLERGWASVFAVDVAAGYFLVRVVFGRSSIMPFFLVVALASNALGFAALLMSDSSQVLNGWALLGLCGAAIALALAGRLRHIQSPWFYLLGAGTLSWIGLYLGGVHPALALVPIIPFLPSRPRDPGFFVDAPAGSTDALDRLEWIVRHPAQIALCLFGLVNAGIALPELEMGVFALPLAALLGRPVGMLVGVAIGRAIGLQLPATIRAREVTVLGLATAIGFTMTLFFATAVLGPGQLLAEFRAGALLTPVAALLALGAAWTLKVGRFTPKPGHMSATHR